MKCISVGKLLGTAAKENNSVVGLTAVKINTSGSFENGYVIIFFIISSELTLKGEKEIEVIVGIRTQH